MPIALRSQLLLADIGGTNARFAHTDAAGHIKDIQVFATSDLEDGTGLATLLARHYDLAALTGAAVALAGPVVSGRGKITNGALALAADELTQSLGLPVVVLNDFEALAHGVPAFESLHPLGDGVAAPGYARAVLGPGTGLGMSLCVPDPQAIGGWRVLPSEGGYADLASTSPLEAEVLSLLQEQESHVCWETVLSGPGLVRLYRTLALIWGDTAAAAAEQTTAAWITEQARDARVPLCHQALELFFGFLGAAAGNLALMGYARGGVYIAGGIIPRVLEAAKVSGLRRRFDERGALSALAAEIPLYLVADPYPGLLGAAVAGSGQLPE